MFLFKIINCIGNVKIYFIESTVVKAITHAQKNIQLRNFIWSVSVIEEFIHIKILSSTRI